MRKWIALLLALVMTLLLVPTAFAAGGSAGTTGKDAPEPVHVYTEEENALLDNGVFADIQTVKNTAAVRMGGGEKMTEADYAAMIPQVAAAVMKSDTYVPGTLRKNGSLLVWQTTVGIPCCYSPRMEAKLAGNRIPGADLKANGGIETVSYDTRGGWPGSVNVAVFQPYYGIDGSFTTQYADEGKSIAQATGGTSTTYIAANATINNIANAIESCGVVIFDSHGTTDYENGYDYTSRANSSYLCLTTSAGITSQDTQAQTGPYGTYYHCMKGSGYAYVDGTCMSNHMDRDATDSLLWMAICLGMATDGLEKPLHDKGVEVVYGYSQSVTFSGDYKWEEYFWEKMKAGEDVKTAIAYMKQKVGNKDPYTNNYPAYPIVVSSEDVYPGHGNVDKVQTVYSTWTLFSQYEVTAVANNPAWGTVSLSGKTITAVPAVGYEVAGYEVIAGTATVTQEGNQFNVNAASDCTVQINFAPRPAATLHFSVPQGAVCPDLSAYIGDEVILPEPTGTVTAGKYGCRFVGWMTEPMAERVTERPTFLRAGTGLKLTAGTQTLYALYSYFVPENEEEDGQYHLVKEVSDSWEGDYVITYNGVNALKASGDITGIAIGGSKAVIALEEAGVVKADDALSNVPDELVFQVVPSDNGTYTVKMKNSDFYLAVTANSDRLDAVSTVSNKSRWTFSMGNSGPVMTSLTYPTRSLQYNASAGLFRAYTNGAKQPLTLYAGAKGTTWFTTDPKEPAVELSAPEITLTNVPATGKIQVSWQAVTGADSYRVYRADSKTGAYTLLQNTAGLKYVDESAVAGQTYYYKVCAVGGGQTGPDSSAAARTCALARPVVTCTHVAATGKNKVTWNAVEGAVGYSIYCATSQNGSYSFCATTKDLMYVHGNAVAGSTYYYKIVAVAANTEANSAPSEIKGLTCALARPVVTCTHVAATGKNRVSWNAVQGAVGYSIYRATSQNGPYSFYTTTKDLVYVHGNAVAGNTYYYKIVAVAANTKANSAPSEIKWLTCALARPVVTVRLTDSGSPRLSWKAVEGAVKYQIYRATSQNGTYSLLSTTTNLSMVNSSAASGVTYYYKVMAVAKNTKANSAYSSVVSIKAGK